MKNIHIQIYEYLKKRKRPASIRDIERYLKYSVNKTVISLHLKRLNKDSKVIRISSTAFKCNTKKKDSVIYFSDVIELITDMVKKTNCGFEQVKKGKAIVGIFKQINGTTKFVLYKNGTYYFDVYNQEVEGILKAHSWERSKKRSAIY